MHPDFTKILSNSREPLTNDLLLAYLKGELSKDAARKVEEYLSEEGMEAEALEGLQNLDPTSISRNEFEIIRRLQATFKQNRQAYHKKQGIGIKTIMIFTGLLLALIIIGWFLVHFLMQG